MRQSRAQPHPRHNPSHRRRHASHTSETIGGPPKNNNANDMNKSASGGRLKRSDGEDKRTAHTGNSPAQSKKETNGQKDTPDRIEQNTAEENPSPRNTTPEDDVPNMECPSSHEAPVITARTMPGTGGPDTPRHNTPPGTPR
ncbi:hypothetical protein SAMN02745178_00021 [Gemmiger formicilis]|uniref:Uncharacterized protein n=1 Tax=Gemmiger formicilis TaxID=745368 RepID=A0A1T4W6I2_9FIRM|nr:hypothetical protein [Gemmiger formicilis]SKA72863.1 hypothetical protein SAMN02745178_00021 [Gemmiger formicilis]